MPKTSRSLRLCGWGIYFLLNCFSPAWADEKRIDCVTDQVPTASEFPLTVPEPGVIEFVRAFKFLKASGVPLRVGALVRLRSVEGRLPETRAFFRNQIPREAIRQAIASQVLDTASAMTVGGAFRLPTDVTGRNRGANAVSTQLLELILSALPDQFPGWLGRIQIDIEFWMRSQSLDGGVTKEPLRIAVQGVWRRAELQARLPSLTLRQPETENVAVVTVAEAVDRLRTGRLRLVLERTSQQASPRLVEISPGIEPTAGPDVVTLQIRGERGQRTSMLPPRLIASLDNSHRRGDALMGALFGDGLVLPMRTLAPPVLDRRQSGWRLPTLAQPTAHTPEALLGATDANTAAFRAELIRFGQEFHESLAHTGRRLAGSIPLTPLDRARAVSWVQDNIRKIAAFRALAANFRHQSVGLSRADLAQALLVLDARLAAHENSVRDLIERPSGESPDFGMMGRAIFDRCTGFRGDFWEYAALFFVPNPVAIRLRPKVAYAEFQQAFLRLRQLVGRSLGQNRAPQSFRELRDRLDRLLDERPEDRSTFHDAETVLTGEMDILFVDTDHVPVAMEVKTLMTPDSQATLITPTVNQLRRDRIFMEAMGIDVSTARFAVYLPSRDSGDWARRFRTLMRSYGFTDDQILVFIGQPR